MTLQADLAKLANAETAAKALAETGSQRLGALSEAFLRQHSPFAELEAAAMDFLCTHLEMVFFPAQSTLISSTSGAVTHLSIVMRGRLWALPEPGAPLVAEAELGPGDAFPLIAVMAGQAVPRDYVALDDCFCARLSSADWQRLLTLSPPLAAYVSRQLAGQLHDLHALAQNHSAEQAGEQRALHTPLTGIGSRQPLAVEGTTSIGAALTMMSARRTGSVAIVDAAGRPLGILTRGDLLDRVVLAAIDLAQPVVEVMSSKPQTLDEHATAYDAMLVMAAQNIRHVLVVDGDGKLSGIVSERDLFALQRSGWRQIRQTIESAQEVTALARASGEVQSLARRLLAQGVASQQLTQFISALNDALTRRVLELNLERHDLFGIDWCWLAFGSEGRDEQTASTDQDNGIVFFRDDFSDRDELKLRLTAFARDVNADLDTCGFPLCKGQIMASNPQWCLTIEEWEERFTHWVRSPEPEALLNATIFFDFRPLFGKVELAARLKRHMLQLTTSTPVFLRAMAANALDVEPPLATFRDFRSDLEPGFPGRIDLKKYGSRLFVDAARIYALASGVSASNTVQRLRQSTVRLNAAAEDIEATIEAFEFIQRLRLRLQLPVDGGAGSGNMLQPESLNELDRRILKEAFRQARKLQQRLKLDYPTA